MEREKPNFYILGRIGRERLARGWSEYTLATISTWRRRNLQPNVTSIEKICHGLGISLSQFFAEDDAVHYLTSEQASLLALWDKLSPAQRTAIIDLIHAFLPEYLPSRSFCLAMLFSSIAFLEKCVRSFPLPCSGSESGIPL